MVVLKNQVSNIKKVVTTKIDNITQSRPAETKGTLYGLGYGAFAGYLFGGAVTFGGGAVVLPLIAITAVTGGLIGNRAGIGKDRQAMLSEIDDEIAADLETLDEE